MSYKIRNTIALGILLLLVVLVGGYIAFFYQPGKIDKYRKQAKKIESQLQNNTEQMNAIADMQGRLRETIHRWNNRTKEISETDLSSQTYGYLSAILDECGALKMNMSLTGNKKKPQYGYNIYKLTGAAEFPNIFRFIWLLENGRKLYKIASITVRAEEEMKDSMEYPRIDLSYDVELDAYFSSEKSLARPVVKPDSTPQPVTSNPFYPSILKVPPANVRNLLEADKINVKAITARKALVLDQDGRLITLTVGDEVYLGKVSSIDPQEGFIEFTLNSGGIIEIVKKKIIFEKQKQGLIR